LFEAVCGGQIGAPPIVEFTHEKMRLRQKVVAFLYLLERWAVIAASRKTLPQPFKGFESFLNGARIALDPLGQFHLAFSDSELRIGRKDMGAMEIEEVGVLDDGLRILLFLEEGFSTFHDDVGVVVLLNRIAHEDLFIRAAQGFLRCILRFGCAGAGGEKTAHRQREAQGRSKPWQSSQDRERVCHYCVKM
jgi:hypothetical protein